jgi:hypothetical protein
MSAQSDSVLFAQSRNVVYRGFGPTLASEYLAKKHDIEVSRETTRKWMVEAKLWRPRRQWVEKMHEWRPRRSRFGELVQWDTSTHDWLEGQGEPLRDATSQWLGRFVPSDSTAENMGVLELYLNKHGHPGAFYTDKAGLFQTAVKTKRGEQREGKTVNRCHLRSRGHSRSWTSSGSRPTLPRRKGAWNEDLGQAGPASKRWQA